MEDVFEAVRSVHMITVTYRLMSLTCSDVRRGDQVGKFGRDGKVYRGFGSQLEDDEARRWSGQGSWVKAPSLYVQECLSEGESA